jgi:hypothetical protein
VQESTGELQLSRPAGLSRSDVKKPTTAIHRIAPSDFRVIETDRIWQEYECHASGISFDRVDDELLTLGQRFECPGCRRWHVAGIDGPKHTFLARPDGELEHRTLPMDAAQRRAWRLEAASWTDDFR